MSNGIRHLSLLDQREPGSKRDRLTREYATDEVVVEWEPRLCYHSQRCVRALPQVFDPNRRPWIDVEAASAEDVEAAVARCPSGALRTRRPGESVARHAEEAELRVVADGPLLVRGDVRIVNSDGAIVYEGNKAALCRCGGSANKPFCDGSHKRNSFHG